ncbi:MAG: uroporphyrinogen decarboxylase family protein [Armatimonadota bacterium]|nr:hypothetical protein [bacterium]
MTPRERVYRALQFQDTDIVPYQVNFTSTARAKLGEFYGNADFEPSIGNHLAILSLRRAGIWTEIAPGHLRDQWGVIWNRTVDKDIGVVENRVLPEPKFDGYSFPDPRQTGASGKYDEFIQHYPDRFRVITIGFSLFERAWSLRGMDNILVDMIESPEFVHELLDRIVEHNLWHIDDILKHDVDCILFGDDWGQQSGLIMGPVLWREFIKPRVAKMYERVKQGGKFVAIHSCGDIKAILPDLVEIGLNVFNPFQPEVLDVVETKNSYHGKLSFYGGISVQHLLPHGTPDEVRRETKRLLDALGKGGGYIASPSHEIPSDVPAENMAAMIEVLKSQ